MIYMMIYQVKLVIFHRYVRLLEVNEETRVVLGAGKRLVHFQATNINNGDGLRIVANEHDVGLPISSV